VIPGLGEPECELTYKEIDARFVSIPELAQLTGFSARQIDYLIRSDRLYPTHYTWSNLHLKAPVWVWLPGTEISSGYRRIWERGSDRLRYVLLLSAWVKMGMSTASAVALAKHHVFGTELPVFLLPLADVELREETDERRNEASQEGSQG
jgi:hypothetical protein